MRFRSLLSEAGRNLATGTSRALLFALLLATITAGVEAQQQQVGRQRRVIVRCVVACERADHTRRSER
jgi:hypothetical protein